MITLPELAPAIGGILLCGGVWLYLSYMKRHVRTPDKADPAE